MRNRITILFLCCIMSTAIVGCGVPQTLSREECKLITESPEVMRVLTTDSVEDSLFLRQQCLYLNVVDINSNEFKELSRKMVATLTSPEQDGVGIAGPQVGISRRVIAVQRFDKEGNPVEVYANPQIEETRGDKEAGSEGCLSVPGRRGKVLRWQDITISYTDPNSDRLDQPRTVREDIKGFTAVIFQHEIDHLDGILYIDKL